LYHFFFVYSVCVVLLAAMDPQAQEVSGQDGMNGQSLSTAREARKRAELDAQLLANRIALLKQEEEKAWRKIEETRKRAGDVMATRAANEEKFKAKEDFYRGKWEAIRQAQAQNAYARDKGRMAREATQNALMEAKRTGVQASKRQAQEHLMAKKERETNDKLGNQDRANYIKRQKDEAKRRMEAERSGKLEMFRADYEARIGQEEMLRARTEALVSAMEKEEMELIQRLQNTQMMQRSAYDELEQALGTTAQPVSRTRGAVDDEPKRDEPVANAAA